MSATISAVILSFNRREALRHTLGVIRSQPWSTGSQIIVVDNGSSDGSAAMVRAEFPEFTLVALASNVLIEGFNIGAARAEGEFLLILDDDSWPEAGAIEAALEHMKSEPRTGGLMLHRRHPQTLGYEWPFDVPSLAGINRGWPDMGCGNLYRREAWMKVGGYEAAYSLYRNDTDMALKLLAAGYDVVFNPAWLVWHDSRIVTRKSNRWLHLSTRNWMWMAKRHASGLLRIRGQMLGWLHAHRLAGWRPGGHWNVLKGAVQGLLTAAPSMPECADPADGRHYRRLLDLTIQLRGT